MLDVRNLDVMQSPCPAEKCEKCPLNHYGMSCTSHRAEYWEEHKAEKTS